MKQLLSSSLLLCCCAACSLTNHWQGTATSQATQATFEVLRGTQSFTLYVPTNDTYLTYAFVPTQGELQVAITSPAAVVLKKRLTAGESASLHLVQQQGVAYQVAVTGKGAAGRFEVRFQPTPH